MDGVGISRRTFLERTGVVAVATALAQLPALLDAKGLLAEAEAQTPGVVTETFNGVFAFFLPGDDPYSVAQGVTAPGRGGVGSGTVPPSIHAVDNFLPASVLGAINTTVPSSGGVALLLNSYAQQVNPNPANRTFSAPFANLSFAEKGGCVPVLRARRASRPDRARAAGSIASTSPTTRRFRTASAGPTRR